MHTQEYNLVSQEPDFESVEKANPIPPRSLPAHARSIICLSIALGASILGNGVFLYQNLSSSRVGLEEFRSPHASLQRNVPISFHQDPIFTSKDRTIANAAWETVNLDHGVVAMPDEYTQSRGIMKAQRFPWDASKVIYLLNSHHNLHCLRTLRTSVIEAHDNATQSRHFSHLMHCLDGLRQDIMCNADDTLRYTGPGGFPTPGDGQVRLCRDFEKLEEWSAQHTACYSHIGNDISGFHEIDHYKNCTSALTI
ncbi:Phenylalanine aminomutase (L-beta-phenylalanine forming) [Lachnellula suecica]|uniref:Phenylalanine aminomutase (L-beta-phenylalanine forming) n=1 Tax=Lachnellula suecica TaxID=602035 RepID=A0A8T9CEC8_9HELO|nr:Phenylalanine aminomutase (L-beta-phenylalanine forming) [Lachnellula suecica]